MPTEHMWRSVHPRPAKVVTLILSLLLLLLYMSGRSILRI